MPNTPFGCMTTEERIQELLASEFNIDSSVPMERALALWLSGHPEGKRPETGEALDCLFEAIRLRSGGNTASRLVLTSLAYHFGYGEEVRFCYETCRPYWENDQLVLGDGSAVHPEAVVDTCDQCGYLFLSSDLYDGYCQVCRDALEEEFEDEDEDEGSYNSVGDLLYSYSTNVLHERDGFKTAKGELGLRRSTVFLGFEAEVEFETREALIALQGDHHLQKWGLFAYDGSLSDMGAELKSVPATFAWHQDHWRSVFNVLGNEAQATRDCGLHIHASRRPISELTLGKLLTFINCDDNEDEISEFAGRDISECRYAEKQYGLNKVVPIADEECRNRYVALNVCNETIEYRLFAGTTSRDRLLECMEFVLSSIAFCKEASIVDLSWEAYLKFLTKRGEYKRLRKRYKLHPIRPSKKLPMREAA